MAPPLSSIGVNDSLTRFCYDALSPGWLAVRHWGKIDVSVSIGDVHCFGQRNDAASALAEIISAGKAADVPSAPPTFEGRYLRVPFATTRLITSLALLVVGVATACYFLGVLGEVSPGSASPVADSLANPQQLPEAGRIDEQITPSPYRETQLADAQERGDGSMYREASKTGDVATPRMVSPVGPAASPEPPPPNNEGVAEPFAETPLSTVESQRADQQERQEVPSVQTTEADLATGQEMRIVSSVDLGRETDLTRSARANPLLGDALHTSRAPMVPEARLAKDLDRAEGLIESGDFSGARLLLSSAVDLGDARAILLLARTYDPKYLPARRYGMSGDNAMADELYRRAEAAAGKRPE